MRKSITNNKHLIISHFLKVIKKGKDLGGPADGYWMADSTTKLKKSLKMSSGQASNFVRIEMVNRNFFGYCVIVEKKNGNNGKNEYTLYDLEKEKLYPENKSNAKKE